MKRKKKKIKRKNLIINILLLLTVSFFIIISLQLMSQRIEIANLKNESTRLITEKKDIIKEIGDLKNEISKSNDLDYIEKQARERLGMIKEGEKIYTDKVDDNANDNEIDTETIIEDN